MAKKIAQNICLHILEQGELDKDEMDLMAMAKKSLQNAYAPYSQFAVGAALLLESGEMLSANNQENAAFPVGICAERVLLSYANANYPNQAPLKIALAAKALGSKNYSSISPCGLCRQTINEYELKFNQEIAIYMLNPSGEIFKADNISQLLPFKFNNFK
ncbi:cytidine deaminase [Echinicola marina]|uniref:cytidine deaminase n=1 Tax=Echinicola marina TaxID=2859768 RepID=UPI001CF6B0A2|nr:cytidine deaminase [Echinicola marina]UCS95143.1 cytidine deaminase [Echinicola marina]